jgi:hypothetical protein
MGWCNSALMASFQVLFRPDINVNSVELLCNLNSRAFTTQKPFPQFSIFNFPDNT